MNFIQPRECLIVMWQSPDTTNQSCLWAWRGRIPTVLRLASAHSLFAATFLRGAWFIREAFRSCPRRKPDMDSMGPTLQQKAWCSFTYNMYFSWTLLPSTFMRTQLQNPVGLFPTALSRIPLVALSDHQICCNRRGFFFPRAIRPVFYATFLTSDQQDSSRPTLGIYDIAKM